MTDTTFAVEGIKLAVSNIELKGRAADQVLKESIFWLYDKYMQTKERCYIEKALDHVKAYAELGFGDLGEDEILDTISGELQIRKDEIFNGELHRMKKVKLNKAQVRSMIKRWNPHWHSMPINQVVADIIEKVEQNQQGIYYYTSGKMDRKSRQGIAKDVYELVIEGDRAVFLDVRRNIYYTILK